MPKVTKPTALRIDRGPKTKKLYALEAKRSAAISAAADELANVLGHEKREMWTKTIPQALFDTLDSFQTDCAEAACVAFLERQGWKVVPPSSDLRNVEIHA